MLCFQISVCSSKSAATPDHHAHTTAPYIHQAKLLEVPGHTGPNDVIVVCKGSTGGCFDEAMASQPGSAAATWVKNVTRILGVMTAEHVNAERKVRVVCEPLRAPLCACVTRAVQHCSRAVPVGCGT